MERTQSAEPHGMPAAESPGRPSRLRIAFRWVPLALLVLALLVLYAAGLRDYLSLEMLHRYAGRLDLFVKEHALIGPAAYLLLYVATVAVSFPGAGFLTIAGGFLFGAGLGTMLAALGATLGATLVFLIARTSLGDLLARRAGPRVQRLREGFQKESFSYVLFLRLVPLFPFWLVNLAAAIFGMRLAPYVTATAIGILPTTFVFAYFGEGLQTTLDTEHPVSLHLLIALVLLGGLALMPVAVRRWRRARMGETGGTDADRKP